MASPELKNLGDKLNPPASLQIFMPPHVGPLRASSFYGQKIRSGGERQSDKDDDCSDMDTFQSEGKIQCFS